MRSFQILFIVFFCSFTQAHLGFAQEFSVETELNMVREYFRSVGPEELADVQADMSSLGAYDRPIDGIWGPGTERAIRGYLETYIAIGGNGPEWGITSPSDTPRFKTWIRQVEASYRLGTEYPD